MSDTKPEVMYQEIAEDAEWECAKCGATGNPHEQRLEEHWKEVHGHI